MLERNTLVDKSATHARISKRYAMIQLSRTARHPLHVENNMPRKTNPKTTEGLETKVGNYLIAAFQNDHELKKIGFSKIHFGLICTDSLVRYGSKCFTFRSFSISIKNHSRRELFLRNESAEMDRLLWRPMCKVPGATRDATL